jgi:aminomethyltransferase
MAQNILVDMGFNNLPKYYEFKTINDLMISRTGYTGEDGFEIMVKNEKACELWDKILSYGKKYGILPIGLGARDTLRLEAALLLYGQDMDETTTPIEATLGWSVAKNKIGNYNGKKIIKEQIENKPNKRLVGFIMQDRAIARHENEIYLDGEKIGVVTSGSISPTLNVNIGLGYIDKPLKTDDEIQIMIRGKLYSAKIVKRPFVEKVNKIIR